MAKNHRRICCFTLLAFTCGIASPWYHSQLPDVSFAKESRQMGAYPGKVSSGASTIISTAGQNSILTYGGHIKQVYMEMRE